MSSQFSKRYYIAFIFSLCLVFVIIISLHSYYNLQKIIQPPSDIWGRTTSLGAADLFKKQPSIVTDGSFTDVLTANKSNFTHIRINRATRETTKEIISLKGVESFKVQKFDWDKNNIYFMERNSLFYSAKNSAGVYSDKIKISDDVKDFDIVSSKDDIILAAAQTDGVILFKSTSKGFEQYGAKFNIDKISNLAAVQDNGGIIYVAAYAEKSAVDFPVYFIAFKDNNWRLLGNVTERSLSRSWTINDIDIGVDDTDAYIFYDMVKWDKFGTSAKTYNAVMPLNSDNAELKFNRFYISKKDAENPDSFASEPKLIKTQDNNIKLTVIKDTYDKNYSDGFSAYLVTMDNGKIVSTARITKNQRLMSNSANIAYGSDNIFVYLDAAGGFDYEAFYTETGIPYYENAKTPSKGDVSLAIIDTIPSYVSSFMLTFIKLSIYSPIILWFLIIEFFEIRKFKDKPRLTYIIGLTIFIIVKLATLGSYYTELSISQMPPVLTFTGAKYIFAILISVLTFFILKLLKKHKTELHIIAEFIIFAIIDVVFTNLLYSTYLV